jgi:hypothetical protein
VTFARGDGWRMIIGPLGYGFLPTTLQLAARPRLFLPLGGRGLLLCEIKRPPGMIPSGPSKRVVTQCSVSLRSSDRHGKAISSNTSGGSASVGDGSSGHASGTDSNGDDSSTRE